MTHTDVTVNRAVFRVFLEMAKSLSAAVEEKPLRRFKAWELSV